MSDRPSTQHCYSVLARYAEMYHTGRFENLEEVLDEKFVIHGALGATTDLDLEGYRQGAQRLRAAFPDLRFHEPFTLVEGRNTASRVRFSGTHEGAILGIAPTGRPVDAAWSFFTRFENEKIAEKWDYPPTWEIARQLGAL
jgi:predicted ester cyclase